MMRRRIKQGAAVAFTLALLASAGMTAKVRAAIGIDTGKACSVTVTLEGLDPDLQKLSIPVRFYRVAEVSETGAYTMSDGYESLRLEDADEQMTAQEWEEKAKEASSLAKELDPEPEAEMEVENGRGVATGLETGMYLVEAEETQSPDQTYTFSPFLLALPNNYYSVGGSDDWEYDVTAGLKPDAEERLGNLLIEKSLATYNQTLGEATFVFSVEAVKDGENVYSDVVSLAFDGAGTREVLVEDIPAGATVTIREVYSGSSYEAAGASQQTAVIVADAEGQEPVQVSFANDYNHGQNGGSGVVNHFSYTEPEDSEETQAEGSWEWSQYRDSTGSQE